MQGKQILFCVLLVSSLAAVSCVTSIDVSSNGLSGGNSKEGGGGYGPRFAIHQDYFIIYDNDDYSLLTLKIYKYDEGINDFKPFAEYNTSSYFANIYPDTNGKWVGTYDGVAKIILFQLNAANPSDITLSSIFVSGFINGLKIMPDDSVVVIYSDRLETFLFDGTLWATNNTLEVSLNENFPFKFYDLTDTHLVNWNTSGGFQIYARNQQLGWDLIEDHETDPSYNYRLTGNSPVRTTLIDAQTVMLQSFYVGDPRDSNAASNGFVIIISKIDGVWTDQILVAADMPSPYPSSTLGYYGYALDSNNVLIAVPKEGYYSVKRSVEAVKGDSIGNWGTAFLLQRGIDNTWKSNAQFVRTGNGYFGAGLGANDKKGFIITCDFVQTSQSTSYNCYPYSFDKCIIAPVNVTCNDIVLNDCNNVDFDKVNLYTQNDADCGVATAKLSGIRVMDNKVVTSFSFTRPLTTTAVTCDASVTCPLATVPAAPVTVSVPVAVSTPTKKVSGVNQLSAVTVGATLSIVSLLL